LVWSESRPCPLRRRLAFTELEVTNLTDEPYYTFVFDESGSSGTSSYSPALPRAWAVTVTRTF